MSKYMIKIKRKKNKNKYHLSKKKEDKNKTKEKISKGIINKEIFSNEIICPDCKETALIDINNFKINFKQCKNK